MREVALAKSRSFAIVEPLIPGLLERSVNVSKHQRDLQRPMDRMPVEGIAKGLPLKTILSNYIGQDIGTVQWSASIMHLYSGARAVEEANLVPAPDFCSGLERSFLQRKVQLDAKSEAMNVDRKVKAPCAVRILHLACQPRQRGDGSGRVCDLV